MKKTIVGLAVAAAFVLPASNVFAGEGAKNHVALVGAITEFDSGVTDPTIGIEYEYLTPLWNGRIGVGAAYEVIIGDHDENVTVAVVNAVVHPWKSSKVILGVGQESGHGVSHSLTRVGLGYDFHVDKFSVGPIFSADFVDGHTNYVIGGAVGMGF